MRGSCSPLSMSTTHVPPMRLRKCVVSSREYGFSDFIEALTGLKTKRK
jgi:hypothetical protein